LNKFDSKVKQVESSIVRRLKDDGASEAHLKRIEELGGPLKVDWNPKVLAGFDPRTRRFIEAKLVEAESLKIERQETIERAKEEADKWEKDKNQRVAQTVKSEIDALASPIVWLKPQVVPAGASAEEKAKVEQQNKFTKEYSELLGQYAKMEQTPQQFAEFAVGTLIAHKLSADLKAASERVTAAEKARDEAVAAQEAAEAEAEKLQKKLDGIKQAGALSRGSRSTTPAAKGIPIVTNPGEHLDSLFRGIRQSA
jgi:hypothetical protein